MRLAYLTDEFLPADITSTIQSVSTVSALGAAGVDVTILSPAAPGAWPTATTIATHYDVAPAFKVEALHNRRTAMRQPAGWNAIAHMARSMARVRRLGVDAIYTRTLDLALAALAATKLPVFFERFSGWPSASPAKRLLYRHLKDRPRFAGLILHSAFAADSYAANGYDSNRMLVARNGIDLRPFANQPSRDAARRELGLACGDRPLAVYAGSVTVAKGIDALLDAARALPEFDLALVGARASGNPIHSRAATLANVRLYPWQDRAGLVKWLSAADILVVPPTRIPLEGYRTVLPMKLFDYLAAGRPIVAGATPDVTEVLTDNVNALLVPPDDSGAFVSCLRAVSANGNLRTRLAAAARKDAADHSWNACGIRIRDFIADRLARS